MSEFSDRPLVAGSLIGLRAFGVDELGRLTSVYHAKPFLPGVNEAECRKKEYDNSGGLFGAFTVHVAREMVGLPPLSEEEKAEAEAKKKAAATVEHTVGGVNCSCGFYAYFDGSNEYKFSSRVSALIEGYGVCSVGSRGFRASRAHLVAIVVPKKVAPHVVARVLHNYPDVPVYASKREALDAHPLTPPAVPTPETDADFWTRSAR